MLHWPATSIDIKKNKLKIIKYRKYIGAANNIPFIWVSTDFGIAFINEETSSFARILWSI